MANRAVLGGSPLGLIGLRSTPSNGGVSSFNGGTSRNNDVNKYNISRDGSLFTGQRVLRAWPQVNMVPGGKDANDKQLPNSYDITGTGDVTYPGTKADDGITILESSDKFKQRTLHNNNMYDTSVLNIIEQLSNTKAQLRPADFAYLKNIGVYPNNRLMVARRFASPVSDNIMVKKGKNDLSALAVLMTWVPENENFLDISFGEEWTESEADFKGVLTALGEDFGLGNLGGIGGAAGNAVPLPGFTEVFQRGFLEKLGLFDAGASNQIPAGNPNLIKQSKRRKTIGYSEAGSGLATTINIKMVCEYELKFISGIDPTIVWMDLLSMILRFGTSSSETYGLSKKVAAKMTKWANDPKSLLVDIVKSIGDALKNITTDLTKKIKDVFDKNKDKPEEVVPEDPPKKLNSLDKATIERDTQLAALKTVTSLIEKITEKTLVATVQKYRVRVLGIVNSLSGLPSTPWHITIGNPLRPTFCSGDMLTTNVNLKLGPTLAFNDLPISITVEFTLANARPWGLQEIMSKFNSGYLRTVDIPKTYFEASDNENIGQLPLDVVYKQNDPPGLTNSGSTNTGNITGTASNTENKTLSQNGQNSNNGEIGKDAYGNPIKK